MRKTETGCRPSQLFGLWAIEPQAFRAMYAQAIRVDLVALGKSQRADTPPSPLNTQRPDVPVKKKPYAMDGPIALFEITGPMTNGATSFQDMLGGTSTIMVRNAIRSAMQDEDVLGACIYMDSPGGTVDGTQALANDIAAFAAQKPAIAYIDGLGCSACYWAASQCTSIIVFLADKARSLGLVDFLGSEDDAMAAVKNRVFFG